MLGGLMPDMVGAGENGGRAARDRAQVQSPVAVRPHASAMLLHWSTLEPAGPSNLAALRFSSPVRVRSLRIFPKNALPFAEQPEIVS